MAEEVNDATKASASYIGIYEAAEGKILVRPY